MAHNELLERLLQGDLDRDKYVHIEDVLQVVGDWLRFEAAQHDLAADHPAENTPLEVVRGHRYAADEFRNLAYEIDPKPAYWAAEELERAKARGREMAAQIQELAE